MSGQSILLFDVFNLQDTIRWHEEDRRMRRVEGGGDRLSGCNKDGEDGDGRAGRR